MIITRLSGGMGNQMFQYAAGRALALKHGVQLGLDLSFLLDRSARKHFTFRNFNLDVFNIEDHIVEPHQVPWQYRKHLRGVLGLYADTFRRRFLKSSGTEKHFTFDSSVLSLGPDAYLEGYWQSPKYFEDIKNIIRQDFTLKEILPEPVELLRKEINNNASVCVHIRRGDFVGNALHDVVSADYYGKAIACIEADQKVEKVYVFSDDIEWCKNNILFSQPTTFVGPEYAGKKAEGHLALMSACRHFVIANSSFSWWAAWLGDHPDKVVIAPARWFADPAIDTSDLLPEEWIRL